MNLPKTYTTEEVAEALGVSKLWVRRRVRRGVVTPLRLSDSRSPMRFTQEHVDQLLATLKPNGNGSAA
jgi:excisionase family DNA binding protein